MGGRSRAKLTPLRALNSLMAFDGSWKRQVTNVAIVMQLEGNIEINKLRERFAECFDLRNDKEGYDKLWSYLVKKGGYVFRAKLETKMEGLDLEEQIVDKWVKDDGG